MDRSDVLLNVSNAVSLIIVYFFTKNQHRDTGIKVETESSKIQAQVADSASKVVAAMPEPQTIRSIDYSDRLNALEKKADIIIANLRKKPGTAWVEEVTEVKEPKE